MSINRLKTKRRKSRRNIKQSRKRRKTFNIYAYETKNEEERIKGLMFVKHKLPEDHGLLFKYSKSKIHGFYMKNTFIPLDIVFLSKNNKILGFKKNVDPHTLTIRKINIPSQNVLELNGGWIDKYGARKGDYIRIKKVKKFF